MSDDPHVMPEIIGDGYRLPALYECADGVWRDQGTIDKYHDEYRRATTAPGPTPLSSVHEVPRGGRPKKTKQRGRPRDTDEKEDDDLFDKWNNRPPHIHTYGQFAAANNRTEPQVKSAIDRARKRRNKS